ncbi:CLC_0170 family protein [Bacillus sp. ISL-75]|uniref:CLC_0170 family protein n=1 Tax=Bacillus sp. ISL-75 TaxID=2819137 RepID=UPI0035ABB939
MQKCFIFLRLFKLAKMYKKAKQKKDHITAYILAWMNIAFGLVSLLANWIYSHFIW